MEHLSVSIPCGHHGYIHLVKSKHVLFFIEIDQVLAKSFDLISPEVICS